jgi:predicted metal-binding protein
MQCFDRSGLLNPSLPILKLMSQHALFVCQSCHSSEDRPDHQPADGTVLLEQLCQSSQLPDDFVIQSVGCLWTCDRPCSVAFSAPQKPTYLFTDIPIDAAALLEFGHLYHASNSGYVSPRRFPEVLQTASIAKIPGIGQAEETEEEEE